MLDNNTAYHSPQIQRAYLVPLAKKFVQTSLDSTSLDEFIEYLLKDKSTDCMKSNLRHWRKDAGKALRLVNTQEIIQSKSTPSVDKVEIHSNEASSMLNDDKTIPKKRLRSNIDATIEFVSVRVPSLKLSNISDTTSTDLRKQIVYFMKSHLTSIPFLPVWPTMLVNGPPFCGKTTLIESACGSLGVRLITVSVGTVSASARCWSDVFTLAKSNAPCVLHLDDIESMEKHSPSPGTFRLTCLLKSHFLKDIIGSNIAIIGETRSLLASLPSSVVDLFTQKLTFGMLTEIHRLNLLRQYLSDPHSVADCTSPINTTQPVHLNKLQLGEGLTCEELARRTPGYEIGDLIRLIAYMKMSDDCEQSDVQVDTVDGSSVMMIMDLSDGDPKECRLINRELVEMSLIAITPSVKNTTEFVTIPNVTWADVGGLEDIKNELYNRFILLIDDWERAQILHRKSGGVLLQGPPGCGKTLVAKALSNQVGLNFLSVKGPEVLNKFQGESERRIREIFERARVCQPCLIFFDEIDAICPRRDSDESTGSRVSLVNQLLVELDGIDKHRSARVFVVGATNRSDMIDPAILRPGRLGMHLTINPPSNSEERFSVLSACTKAATAPHIEGGLDTLRSLAKNKLTDNMSGADLDNLLELAKQKAQLNAQNYVSEQNMINALKEVKHVR